MLLRRVPEPPAGPRLPALQGFGRVLRHRWALVVLGLVLCEGLVLVALLTSLPLTLQSAGWSASIAGLVMAAYRVAVFAFSPLVQRLSRWVAPATLVGVGATTGTGAYAVLVIGHGVPPAYSLDAPSSATWAVLHTTMQISVTDVVPEARAAAVSLFASSLFTGAAVGSAVGAGFIEH